MRSTRVGSLLLLLASLALVVGCGGDDEPQLADECNPLGGGGCITPWPSSIYQAVDETTETGYRLAIPDGALPSNNDGTPIDPTRLNEHDGFSPSSFMFTTFEGGVDPSNLVHHTRIDDSVTDASPTVVIDMETGERVHHFAEIDANAMAFEIDEQALYIRPANRLEPSRRYAVGIRRSLKRADGADLPSPPAFDKLRAGEAVGHARLSAVAGGYPAIFEAFENAGIPRDDLVVAWDFVTASDEHLTEKMLSVREAGLAAAGDLAANVTYTVTTDDAEEDDDRIMRRVIGKYEAPMVLTSDDDLGRLNRDANGDVVVDGTYGAKYVAMVPTCASAAKPVPVLIFGHGFFGDLGEAQSDYLRRVADELCVIIIGTEWTGMARADVASAALALGEASRMISYGEQLLQGVLNTMVLVQLTRGAFASELLLDGADPLIDTDRIYFYGISQGHILGTMAFGYDPYLERGAFAVGGTNWGLLFERSSNWPTFHLILSGAYPGPLNTVIIESLMQLGYDYVENHHISHRILADGMPGTPQKQMLLNMAVADSSVTNLASEMQARALGIPVLTPTVKTPWGVPEAAGPLTSGLAIYDEKPSPPPPDTNARVNENNGTHGSVRERDAANRQLAHFFETGEIINECDGACDCAAGACE